MIRIFTNHLQLLQYISNSPWKQKIAFFQEKTQQINQGIFTLPIKILQNCWGQFLSEKNLNVLVKIIACLHSFLTNHQISSSKNRRLIIEKLLRLGKMRRIQIDCSIAQIIKILVRKEKKQFNLFQRSSQNPWALETFNSLRNPTFLFGSQQMQEEETQIPIEIEQASFPNSQTVSVILTCLKQCSHEIFNLILLIVNQLAQQNIVSTNDLKLLKQDIAYVKEVVVKGRKKEQGNEVEQMVEKVILKIESMI